jgi:hypothetical protein
MNFQYPAHPNTGRTDPFVGPDGKNPFADADASSPPTPDSPYAVPAGEGGISYRPIYEAVCPHRGRTVFWLGASGCVCVAAAAMSAGALWAIPSAATTLAGAFCPVLIIAALTAGGTAWMLGRHDLTAIRSGAMDPTGMKMTRRGHRLGVVGTLIAVGVVATFVASLALR